MATTEPMFGGVPVAFILFTMVLLGVALSHRHALKIAAIGLAVIVTYRLVFTNLPVIDILAHEWVTLVNLFGLLTGFAVVAAHFEHSGVPALLPRWLPSGRAGAFGLLALVWVLSGFLDNIAAALIGGTVARDLFRGRVHVGYIAAIVAVANAGGAGSVLGDTTTTMMWLAGVSPLAVLEAYVGAVVVLVFCGVVASAQQTKLSPIIDDAPSDVRVDSTRVVIVLAVLTVLVITNGSLSHVLGEQMDHFPYLAASLWLSLLVSSRIRPLPWDLVSKAAYGSLFLLALVLCAAFMPVHSLPTPSQTSTLLLGFTSAIFDNIPLTKVALAQGGYDWGVLAYAVGVGGSMVWFGSSAGVAVSSVYEEARSLRLWLRHGWHVPVSFVLGYLAIMAILGWHPN